MFGKKKDKKEKKKGRRFFSLDSHATMDMDLRSNWSIFKALCGFVLSAEKTPLLDISVAKRAWGIEGWTSEEVERWRVRRQFWGMIVMGFMLALMFLAGYNWWNDSFGLISGIGYTFALLATASLSTVYLWQSDMIGGTEFVPYVEYISRFKWLLMLIAVLGWASMDQTALMAAQAVDLPDTKITRTGDLSAKFVGSIIGAPWESYAQDGMVFYGMYSVLLPILAALDTGALAFVSIFAVYIHTFGAVNIAHTGKWDNTPMFNVFWSPIRTVVALALCSPLTNGVSLLHHIVLVAVAMSINLANNVSDVFMGYLNEHDLQLSAVRPYKSNKDFESIFNNMFFSVVRQVGFKNFNQEETKDGIKCISKEVVDNVDSFSGITLESHYDLSCTISRPTNEIGEETVIIISLKNNGDAEGYKIALVQMYEQMYTMVGKYIAEKIDDRKRDKVALTEDIKEIYANFKNNIENFVSSAKKPNEEEKSRELLQDMTKLTAEYGWMTVGMYPFVIARAQAGMQDKMDIGVTFQNANMNFDEEWTKFSTVETAEKFQLQQFISDVNSITGVLSRTEDDIFKKTAAATNKNGWLYMLSEIGGIGPKDIANMFIDSNAIAALNQQGTNIITAGATVLTVFGGVKGAVSGKNKSFTEFFLGNSLFSNIAGGVVEVWSPLIVFTCGLVMAFGFSCAYILPALPIIFWARALVSWAIMLVQTMMGAPFWAAAHIFPEGAGLAGQHARQGYLMLLDVFIRPTLLVCGAIMCMLLLEAWTQILAQILLLWSDITVKAAGFSIFGTLIMSCITMFVLYTTIKYLFVEALGGFPAQVMKWCGSHAMAEDGRNDAAASVSTITTKTGQGLSGMAMGLSAPKPDNRNNGGGSGNVGKRPTKS